MLCIVLLWVFACSLWEGCPFVCDAVAPDTLLGLKLQDNSACARLHSAVLLHYHIKFQVNPRVDLEASCCALFCYEYLLALYGRDAFLSVMLWLLTHCWASSCRTTLLVHACTQQCCSTTTWSSRWTQGLTWRLHAVHCSAMSICLLSMGGMPFCLWCCGSWHTAGPQAAGQLCLCTLALSSAAPLPHEVPGEPKG